MKKLLYLALVMLVGISLASCNKKKNSTNDPEYDDTEYALSLSTTSTEIIVGNSIDINAIVTPTPKNAVIWASDFDDACIDVMVDEDGTCHIKGKKVTSGTTFKIGATIGYKELDPVSCKIAVVNNGVVVKEGTKTIAAGTQYDLLVGNTVQLSAALAKSEPGTTTWSSSSTSIATVSNTGLVKAVKAGTATITVTIKTNSGNTYTSTVNVRVNAPLKCTLNATGNSLNGQDVTGKIVTLTWGASATLVLNSSDFNYSVDGTGVTASKSGQNVTVKLGNGIAKDVKLTFTLGTQSISVTIRPFIPDMGEILVDGKTTGFSMNKLSGQLSLSGWKDFTNVSDITWTTGSPGCVALGTEGTYYTGGVTSNYNIRGYKSSVTITAKWSKDGVEKKVTKTISMAGPTGLTQLINGQDNRNYMRTWLQSATVNASLKNGSSKYDPTFFTWSSNKTSVATVGNQSSNAGVITIKGYGSAIITATCGSTELKWYVDVVPHFYGFSGDNSGYFICPTNLEHKYGTTTVEPKDYTLSPPNWVSSQAENEYIGKTGASGHTMDLFGWATCTWNTVAGIEQYQTSDDEDYVRGTATLYEGKGKIGTLQCPCSLFLFTDNQWDYILNKRTKPTGLERYYTVKYSNNGVTTSMLLLIPNEFTSSKLPFVPVNGNTYNAGEIQNLKNAGVVCMPAGFMRNKQSVSSSTSTGWYWTNTNTNESHFTKDAYALKFTSSSVEVHNDEYRSKGYYIRAAVSLPAYGSK